MTREDKIKAFEMRLDGATMQEVADHFGVTRQRVEQIFKPHRERKKPNARFKCIWPGLKRWMFDNCVSATKMNDDLCLFKSIVSFYRVLQGEHALQMDKIKAILKYTGMTFEEAFGEEVPLSGCDKDG